MGQSEQSDSKVFKKFCMQNMKGILEAVEQEKNLCNLVETVREYTYLGDKVSAGGGYESTVTAKIRFMWIKLRECCELLHGRRISLRLKGPVYNSNVRPTKKVRWEFYEGQKDPW